MLRNRIEYLCECCMVWLSVQEYTLSVSLKTIILFNVIFVKMVRYAMREDYLIKFKDKKI